MFDPVRKESAMAIAVVVPSRLADRSRPVQVYARRRLMVLFVVAAIALVLLVSTGHVVANRGGAPASTPAVRPANSAVYVVQAGDTLWSIGERYHGHTPLADYVDSLVAANGGTEIQLSQALTLP
jgi:4-amino-4-deoxy-L-arabinose transferase-like glycosyltransferase